MEKGLTFRNKNLQADEFFGFEELEGKTFDQIAHELWNRLRRKSVAFRSDIEVAERDPSRQPTKFSWKPPTGSGYQPINGARGVLEFIHDTGAREIYYYFAPIGGAGHETFIEHAQEITRRPRDFGRWTEGRSNNGTFQLEKVVLDKFRRTVHVYIRPVPRYPEAPPKVITSPPISDQCFSGGTLQWARALETGQLIWSEHTASSNPLAELLDELRRKYHVF